MWSMGQSDSVCFFLLFEFFWEYPEAVPEVVPEGKESGAYELA